MRSAYMLLAGLMTANLIATASSTVVECQKCHGKANLAKLDSHGRAQSLFVEPIAYAASVHGSLECTACHVDLAQVRQFPHPASLRPVTCASCHLQEGQDFAASGHAKIKTASYPLGMDCPSCHGSHAILNAKNPKSSINRANLSTLCLECHEDECDSLSVQVQVKAYRNSIHGRRALMHGDEFAAQCVDCHGSHRILPASDSNSSINKPHIPETCGRCHTAELEDYRKSIHGEALASGVPEAPVCTSCHGEHTIELPQLEASSVSAEHIPETCGRCHEDVQLTEKYGLAAARFSTYNDSFHGLANEYGKTVAANCASCHGYHRILAPNDPASSVNPSNLAATCGKCHPNAGENFTKGKMHVQATIENSPGVFYVRRFYYIFIGGLMLLFLAYILLEYTGFIKRRRQRRGA